MIEQWVVQIEMVGDVQTPTGYFSFDRILQNLADCSPGLLHSPERIALVLHLAAKTAVDAHLLAVNRWHRAIEGSAAGEWHMVRVEAFTAAEFERECRVVEGGEELALAPAGGREGETEADRLLRNVFEDPLTRLPTGESFRVHLQVLLNGRRDYDKRHAVIAVQLKSGSEPIRANRELNDLALLEATKRISSRIRTGDMVARLEEDTLALLVKDIGDEKATHLAERILKVLTEPGAPSGTRWWVSGIGIAVSSWGSDADRVVASALAALESARNKGGDRYRLFPADAEQLAAPGTDMHFEPLPESTEGA